MHQTHKRKWVSKRLIPSITKSVSKIQAIESLPTDLLPLKSVAFARRLATILRHRQLRQHLTVAFAASWVLDLHGHEIVYGIMCLDIVHPRILVQNAVFVKQQIPPKRSWSPSSASTWCMSWPMPKQCSEMQISSNSLHRSSMMYPTLVWQEF